jgi:hypothetical protein
MRLVVFFVVYFSALSWPVMQGFNRVEPFILGLPFSMAWVVAWVLLGWLVLILRYRSDRRAER